jgi:hypothetical protein
MDLVQRIETLEQRLFDLVIQMEKKMGALQYDFVGCAQDIADMKLIIEHVWLIKKDRLKKKNVEHEMDKYIL